MIMVGDSVDDMTAGAKAGAVTVLLVNKENDHLRSHEHTTVQIARYEGSVVDCGSSLADSRRLDDLIEVLEVASAPSAEKP